MSGKLHFKTNTVIRDKERHYIMINGSVQKSDIMFVNIYACKDIKEILIDLKREKDSIGVFNTPLSKRIDHPDKKPIRRHWP